jgi:hypothetical protein
VAVAQDRSTIVSLFHEATARLASNRTQLAELVAVEHEARTRTWFEHPSDKVSERDRVADYQTLDLASDVIRLKGEIAADEDWVRFYVAVLNGTG